MNQFEYSFNVARNINSKLMRNIISRNPYTGQIRQQIPFITSQILHKQIERSSEGYNIHSKRQAKEKMAIIKQLTSLIGRRKTQISKLITFQTGKPITQSEYEVQRTLKICQYYSKLHDAILPINIKTQAKKKTLIKFLPTGTILCILPFNYPFLSNFYKSLPQIYLGNSVLVKNSDSTPGVGALCENLMTKAGFQSGQYQNIFSSVDQTQELLSNNQITGVTFTGSTQSGQRVASIAGKYLKKSSLFLGSNDAMIVLEDGNIDLAVQCLLKTGYNSGQGGPNPKRIIIKQQIYQQFKQKLILKIKAIKFGNPLLKETTMGPMARTDLYERLQRQLSQLEPKFKIAYQRYEMKQPFFPITVFEGGQQSYDEQIIGPVFFLYKAKDDASIIKLANNTKYGQNAYLFSAQKGEDIIDQINCSTVFRNEIYQQNVYCPFGGFGKSGYGREGWQEGIRQFCNIKVHYVN